MSKQFIVMLDVAPVVVYEDEDELWADFQNNKVAWLREQLGNTLTEDMIEVRAIEVFAEDFRNTKIIEG